MAKGISEADKEFLSEYMVNGFNATKAYLKVFAASNPLLAYNDAKSSAYRLLSKPSMKKLYDKKLKEINEATNVRREELIMGLKELMISSVAAGDIPNYLKAIDMINKMVGNYTTFIDANINQDIVLTISGLEEETKKDDDDEELDA